MFFSDGVWSFMSVQFGGEVFEVGFLGIVFCYIGGNVMVVVIKFRSIFCCVLGCVVDIGVGFFVKNSKVQSFLQVCGSVGVGGNLCYVWSCKGRFGSGQIVFLFN